MTEDKLTKHQKPLYLQKYYKYTGNGLSHSSIWKKIYTRFRIFYCVLIFFLYYKRVKCKTFDNINYFQHYSTPRRVYTTWKGIGSHSVNCLWPLREEVERKKKSCEKEEVT